MAKFKKLNKKRRPALKASKTKLSNKKTTKLLKRGKVKPKTDYKTAYRRTRDITDSKKNGSQKTEEDDVVADDVMDMLDEDDITFHGNKATTFSKTQVVEDLAETTDDDEAEDYERVPRTGFMPENRVHYLLPLKGEHGIIQQAPLTLQESSDDEVDAADADDASVPIEEAKQPTTLVELYAKREERLAEVKGKIGSCCFSVVSNPEENIRKLKDIILLLDSREPGVYVRIRKMAAASLVEVFRDIIPAYRIRQESESDKAKRMKKETKKLREFEDSLLRYYKKFLISLEKMIKVLKKQMPQHLDHREKANRKVAAIAMTCFSQLLLCHPHFNFRNNIIKVIIDATLHKDSVLAAPCYTTLSRLFKADKVGEVSLEAVKQMKQLIKSRCYNVSPEVLETFLSLNVQEASVADGLKTKKDLKKIRQQIMKMSRKERKWNKKLVELEKELLETEAEESKQKKTKFHTEILEIIFFIYFRILKTVGTNRSVLLAPVLEGLSKFAHLINIDFFDDLISLLYSLIESGHLNMHEILHCLKTVFTILSGQGSNLLIDRRGFYNHLYQLLLEMQTSVLSNDLETLLQCLDVMLTQRRKQVTLQRILAFIKRLCTVSLQSTSNFTLALLSAVRCYVQSHKQSDALLDTEHVGSGEFLPELGDPEHCNAHTTSLWEMHYLVRHYHPVVGKFATHVLRGCPLQGQGQLHPELSQKLPHELYAIYNDTEEFNPPLQPPTSQQNQKRTRKLHECILSSDSIMSQAVNYFVL